MPLYDQLIEFAREKQRGRRSAVVHKGVPNPIIVLVIGDKQGEYLDTLYTRLRGRWSSRLKALQMCYCYVNEPYRGDSPILQVRLELPETGGAGGLCTRPDTLAAANDMVSQAIEQISQDPQISMRRGDIHVILSPEDPAGGLLSDLSAVVKGRLEDFGFFTIDCRLYLLLPQALQSKKECRYVCNVMDQLRDAQSYEQAVLQPQTDAPPRVCQIKRLINAVMLLDNVNENGQHYNVHGERLGLLLDLVENGWDNAGFVQTAGAREGSAGPEYWLAQALDTLCSERQEGNQREENSAVLKTVTAQIADAAQARTGGVDRALRACCLFRPGQPGRARQMTLEELETAVFGEALKSAFSAWRRGLDTPRLPQAVLDTVDGISSQAGLDGLVRQLDDWVRECELKQVRPLESRRVNLAFEGDEAEDAARLRACLYKEKYLPLAEEEKQSCCGELIGQCKKYCLERKEELRGEEADFAEFAKEVRQVWITLRDAYNDGRRMELTWIGSRPSPGALRKACAEAFRSEDPTQVLSMAADCVDLSGADTAGANCADPPLFCRIPFAIGLNTWVRPITEGVSVGRVLKFAVLSQEYDEELLQRVHVLKKARESLLAE